MTTASMTQKDHAGASHLPRARPGSGRVTISVAVGAGEGAGADDGASSGERLGCRIQVGAVYTHGPAFATSGHGAAGPGPGGRGGAGRRDGPVDGRTSLPAPRMADESAFDSVPAVVRTAWR